MRWPWVSRRAYEDVKAHNAILETRITDLMGHMKRVDRKEAGLPEVPYREKQKDPMPPEIWTLYRQLYGEASSHTQESQRKGILKLYAETGSWDVVQEALMEELGA